MVEPPNSVLLLVGRDEFTPPTALAGQPCAATTDCLAVGVVNVDDAPTLVSRGKERGAPELIRLGDFELVCDGKLSLRDVYNREYEAMVIEPGLVRLSVWGNDDMEPCEVVFQVDPTT
jgi:hypothetical protein